MDHISDINYSLICAVRDGRIETVKELITSYGLSYSESDGYVLLCESIKNGHTKVTKMLLLSGCKVNKRNKRNKTSCGTALHLAVKNGNKEIVSMLLERGAQINATNKFGNTPLHEAIIHNKMRIIHLLLKYNANVNASDNRGLSPLYIAVMYNHPKIVNLLLTRGAKVDYQNMDGKTVLYLAVEQGNLQIIEHILKYGPDINKKNNKNCLNAAVYNLANDGSKIIQKLLQYGFSLNPEDIYDGKLLCSAVFNGYFEIVEDLLKRGADVNILSNVIFDRDCTPLHIASLLHRVEIAILLINYGADTNAKDDQNKTPIFYAITKSNLKLTELLLTNGAVRKDNTQLLNTAFTIKSREIVKVLLQHGADINAKDEKELTALHYLSSVHHSVRDDSFYTSVKIAKLLLNQGAEINAKTKLGETPLHLALSYRNTDIGKLYLKCGAKVDSAIKNGVTPLHLAALKGLTEIVRILLDVGADIDSRDENDETPLHVACEALRPKIVKILLENGSDINILSKQNYTPFNIAINNLNSFDNSNNMYSFSEFGYDNVDYEFAEEDNFDFFNYYCRDDYVDYYYDDDAFYFEDFDVFDDYDDDLDDDSDDCDDDDYDYDYYDDNDNNEIDDDDDDDDDAYSYNSGLCSDREKTIHYLNQHIFKMITANLYVSEQNLFLFNRKKNSKLQSAYEKEVEIMKKVKIRGSNFSFYDFLNKNISQLAICVRNETIVQVLKSDDYKRKFPHYGSMINSCFKKAMKRKELVEQVSKCLHSLFNMLPELPYNCTDKIFSYLNNEDLKILLDVSK